MLMMIGLERKRRWGHDWGWMDEVEGSFSSSMSIHIYRQLPRLNMYERKRTGRFGKVTQNRGAEMANLVWLASAWEIDDLFQIRLHTQSDMEHVGTDDLVSSDASLSKEGHEQLTNRSRP